MSVLSLEFKENHLLSALAAPPDSWLDVLAGKLNVQIFQRGNIVTIEGEGESCHRAADCLKQLYETASHEKTFTGDSAFKTNLPASYHMDSLLANSISDRDSTEDSIRIGNKVLHAANLAQARYIKAIHTHLLVIATGPAGTGKTHLAVGFAAKLLLEDQIERVILSRPAVEAGERLGYLPGDMRDKIDPYFQPIYDSLYYFLGREKTEKMIAIGRIEIAPLAYMRGRTLKNAFILLDEAQNSTPVQMKMFLTRFGENSHMVINGDLSQIDLPKGQVSGLKDAISRLETINDIAICHFSLHDVVRHHLVTHILQAYETDL